MNEMLYASFNSANTSDIVGLCDASSLSTHLTANTADMVYLINKDYRNLMLHLSFKRYKADSEEKRKFTNTTYP
jgi:hypothetical protein